MGQRFRFTSAGRLVAAGFGRKLLGNRSFEALQPAVEKEGWKIILLSQLHPFFPTSLLNYLYGLTTIRFRTCIIWVAVGQAPGLFLYTYIGTLGQLGLNLLRGKTHPRLFEYWLWGSGLLLSFAILFILGRVALRLLEDVEKAGRAQRDGLLHRPASHPGSAVEIWAHK